MPAPTAQDSPTTLPIVAAWQRPVLTARGTAVLRILELADLVRALDRADREYRGPGTVPGPHRRNDR